MSHSPTIADLSEAHRLALASLREMGMEIAQRLHAQSQEPNADLGDVATKFARVARAVRQTIALEARLVEMARLRAEASAAGRPHTVDSVAVTAMQRAEERQRGAEQKLEVVTLVRRAAAKTPGLDLMDFDERLYERLDEDPYDKAFDVRADISQTIAAICRDLGLDPDWNGLPDLDWRQISLELRSALTGQPIATLPEPLYQRKKPRTLPQRSMPIPESWRRRRQAKDGPGP